MALSSNIPYHQQRSEETCGPACLRMVLLHYGKDVSETTLAEQCGTDEFGTTCAMLAEAAERLGFRAEAHEGITLKVLRDDLRQGRPVIALVDGGILYGGIELFGHFVLIIDVEEEHVILHDPDFKPNYRVEDRVFFEAWKQFNFAGVRIWKRRKK